MLLFFDASGIGAMTSQCSTSLPFVTRKMSTPTSPFGLNEADPVRVDGDDVAVGDDAADIALGVRGRSSGSQLM